MNFLGLPFLFALPLVVVPVIIHLYRGRQRDVIPWGAMQFLAAATTKGRSLQRLEELLLMLLRVAALAALIFALARPMVRSAWFGTVAEREVVMLLDNSLSMARTVDEVSAHDQLIEKAREFIAELSPSDTVHVLLASGGGQWLTAEGITADSAGLRQLNSALEQLQPTRGTADLLACLQIAVNLEPHNEPRSRHIAVFTDNQSASWQPDAESGWQHLGAAREKAALPTTIEVVACQLEEDQLENLAVMKLESSRQLLRPAETVELSAELANLGDQPCESTTVEWLIDDQVFDTTDIESLAAGESVSISTKLSLEESGNFAVHCRLRSEDQIALDDQETVVLEVSDELPILVVYDGVEDPQDKATDELFSAALGYSGGQPQEWHAVYRPELVSSSQLADAELAKYRAIVLLNLVELAAESRQALQSFVRGGGGLWVALGDFVERDAFNRFWYDDGGGLSPTSLASLVSVADTNTPEGMIHPPERDHPATMQLANTTQLDIDQVRLSEYWRLVPASEREDQVWVLLEAGDGSPLVVENLIGQGRVIVQAFPLGLEWTNLPQLKSYVVMIQDWLDYLTAPAMARYNLRPSELISSPVPAGADYATAKLTTPAGQTITLANAGSEEESLVRYSQTQLPGLYQLTFETADEDVRVPFYVARDSEESRYQLLDEPQRERLLSLAHVQFEANQAPEPEPTAEPTARTEPIWGALLLALVLLLIGEQFFSSWLARQRSGAPVSVS